MLYGGQAELGFGGAERAQARPLRLRGSERRELGCDQDPVPATAVAAKLDVVARGGRGGKPVISRPARAPAALAAVRHRAVRRLAQAQPGAALAQRVEHADRAVVERDDRAADGVRGAGAGMSEQGRHELGLGVRGEAEPPVLVGPREVDQSLIAAAGRPAPSQRAGKLLADLRPAGEPVDQT